MDGNDETRDQKVLHRPEETEPVIIEPNTTAPQDSDFSSDQYSWFTNRTRPFQSLLEILKEKQGTRKAAKSEKPKIKVNTRSVLQDLRKGLDDQVIMEKYSLSLRQLQKLYRKMIKSGMLTPMEVSDRLCVTTSQIANTFKQAAQLIENHEAWDSRVPCEREPGE
jgi:hypothetical protein